jgi:hypothetical protein
MAVLVSIGIIVITLLICDYIRNLIVIKCRGEFNLAQKIILDGILAIELCGPALELGVIFQHYGIAVWTIGLYFNCFYQLIRWRNLSPPSPYAHVIGWLSGQMSALEMVICRSWKILNQLS